MSNGTRQMPLGEFLERLELTQLGVPVTFKNLTLQGNADMPPAQAELVVRNVNFLNCVFAGYWDAVFEYCAFQGCHFEPDAAPGVRFEGCDLARTLIHGGAWQAGRAAWLQDSRFSVSHEQFFPSERLEYIPDAKGGIVPRAVVELNADADNAQAQPELTALELGGEPTPYEPDSPADEPAFTDDEYEAALDGGFSTHSEEPDEPHYEPYLIRHVFTTKRGKGQGHVYVFSVDDDTNIVTYSGDILRSVGFSEEKLDVLKAGERWTPADGYFLWLYARYIPGSKASGEKARWDVKNANYSDIPF